MQSLEVCALLLLSSLVSPSYSVCSGIERREQQQLMITWAAAQASQKQSWLHGRSRTAAPKVEHSLSVPAPSRARSQQQ